ncbi:hypothetical protein EVAR_33581_1 [Eumeta japonica]|uniref:Uncharacterized protein n=1 Tax=Eumeta variegata TaxID=151549 RepID=A0A4C1VJR9_EUMVA|nr:hypothetical protein EVAR_33581_1 [Eumeta japonica]
MTMVPLWSDLEASSQEIVGKLENIILKGGRIKKCGWRVKGSCGWDVDLVDNYICKEQGVRCGVGPGVGAASVGRGALFNQHAAVCVGHKPRNQLIRRRYRGRPAFALS